MKMAIEELHFVDANNANRALGINTAANASQKQINRSIGAFLQHRDLQGN
ncbi:hypothetical protein ACFSUD_08505 [Sulfitobacter aestuarii]|uniref:Uncharacterized protein n=1 Tax=Sulfitobacter aestuarii TaxID=2161676 RepID=A0ABW5U131_9RHOB